MIFKGIGRFEEKIRSLQGAYKDLGKEEIEEEVVMSSIAAAYMDIVNAVKSIGFSEIEE